MSLVGAVAMHLSSLHLYPLKSASGVAVETLDIESRGPRHDRRWLAIDADGRFITARQVSSMVLIRADMTGNSLHLSAPGMPGLDVAPPVPDAARLPVSIWKDMVDALREHGEYGEGEQGTAVAEAINSLKASEVERAREVWRKKFAEPALDAAARGKQMRFLAARGFGSDAIRRALSQADQD